MTAPAETIDLADWPVAVLAGGLAKRLRPITDTIPKALVPVAGAPFLAHQLRLLRSAGLRRIVICAGYLGEMIEAEIGDGARLDLRIDYSFDGPRLLGTGGALKRALPLLGDRFFVLYGDSYLPVDYQKVALAFATGGKAADGCLPKPGPLGHEQRPIRSGPNPPLRQRAAHSGNASHRLWSWHLRTESFASWPDNEPFDLADVYRRLLSENQLEGHEVTERFYEIGSPEGLAELEAFLTHHAAVSGAS